MIAPPVSSARNQPWAGVWQYARMNTRLPYGMTRGSVATACQNGSARVRRGSKCNGTGDVT